MKRAMKIGAAAIAICLGAALLSGCAKGEVPELAEPKIEPPTIKEAGKLYVGVDYGYMPYSGEVNGEVEGLDADVASLIANDLGLTVEFVDVAHDDSATAIADGTVDIVMSAVLGEVDSSVVAVSGVYAEEAPAIFTTASEVEAMQNGGLSTAKVGVQADTMAGWAATERGVGEAVTYDTLNDAFDALVDGEVQAVACDAVVGAYLSGHYKNVVFVEQTGAARLIGVGVSANNVDLQTAVQGVLDAAREDGRLKLVLAKWIGDLPELSVEGTATTTGVDGDETAADGASDGSSE